MLSKLRNLSAAAFGIGTGLYWGWLWSRALWGWGAVLLIGCLILPLATRLIASTHKFLISLIPGLVMPPTVWYFARRVITEGTQPDHAMVVLGALTLLGGPVISAGIYAYLASLNDERLERKE